MEPDYQPRDVLKELGLDQMPEARLPGVQKAEDLNPRSNITFKMAVQLIDPIESAAFMRYVPDWVEIDQSLDARSFNPDCSRVMSIFTDIPIPVDPRLTKALGITAEPNAQNLYLCLANDLVRHLTELGAAATSPISIFRTSGAEGHRPLIGAIFKLRYDLPDGQTRYDVGSNLGLLSTKRTPEIHTDEP